eukprot:9129704-Alexandrium_andersonii.AAC.1
MQSTPGAEDPAALTACSTQPADHSGQSGGKRASAPRRVSSQRWRCPQPSLPIWHGPKTFSQ